MIFDNTKGYNWIFNIIAIGLIFICVLLFLNPVSGLENYTIVETNSSDTSISWNVDYISAFRPIGATFDGVEIENFQLMYNNTYTASELKADSFHTFCIYDNTSINCLIGNTTPSREPVTQMASLFYLYIYAIIAIILIGVSSYFKIKEIAMVGFIFAVIGFALTPSTDGVSMIIYGLIMASAVTLTFVQE